MSSLDWALDTEPVIPSDRSESRDSGGRRDREPVPFELRSFTRRRELTADAEPSYLDAATLCAEEQAHEIAPDAPDVTVRIVEDDDGPLTLGEIAVVGR